MSEPLDEGVQFALLDGKRSSQSTGKAVFARAAAAVDTGLASRIESQGEWRRSYLSPVRELVEAGARSPKDALRIAGDGLAAARGCFVFHRDGEQRPLSEALVDSGSDRFGTADIQGEEEPSTELVIPYRGRQLTGDA